MQYIGITGKHYIGYMLHITSTRAERCITVVSMVVTVVKMLTILTIVINAITLGPYDSYLMCCVGLHWYYDIRTSVFVI